jgi:hypothetical protein
MNFGQDVSCSASMKNRIADPSPVYLQTYTNTILHWYSRIIKFLFNEIIQNKREEYPTFAKFIHLEILKTFF